MEQTNLNSFRKMYQFDMFLDRKGHFNGVFHWVMILYPLWVLDTPTWVSQQHGSTRRRTPKIMVSDNLIKLVRSGTLAPAVKYV